MTINAVTRQLVRQRANYLCEYCHSSEEDSTTRFTIDHRLFLPNLRDLNFQVSQELK